jgi:transcriptional regulator with XRE-family HTH domain
MTHESLALKLRVLRAERALTIEQAARQAGVTPETISDAERGRRRPYLPTLRKVAAAYGVPVEELLAEEAEPALASAATGKGEASEAERAGSRQELVTEAQQLASRLLRAWRAYVWDLVLRWEKEGGQPTAAQVRDVIDALQRLIDSGVFERPAETLTTKDWREVSDWFEVSTLFKGIDRLRAIAERAVTDEETITDEEAERVRNTWKVIDGLSNTWENPPVPASTLGSPGLEKPG